MTDQTVPEHANSPVSTLGKKVIRITLLLVGTHVIHVILPPLILSIADNDFVWSVANHYYSLFISNAIFACVVYAMMRRNPAVIPVSILAFVYPVYGGVMYLLSTCLLQDNE
ncbi:MAG TPA: hypothetical protein VIU12_35640 [Chryseolinea sp.]